MYEPTSVVEEAVRPFTEEELLKAQRTSQGPALKMSLKYSSRNK